MKTLTRAAEQLSLSPLGAGDLIDRTVRLYRQHFATLIRASAPPVMVSGVGAVLGTIGLRELRLADDGGAALAYFGIMAIGFVIQLLGLLFLLIVMGGASRNLVMHLLRGDAVLTRSIYRNVRARFWRLLAATSLVFFWATVCFLIAVFSFYLVFAVIVLVGFLAGSSGGLAAWIATLFGGIGVLAASVGALLFFFFLVGRVAYVPQVLLVEGRGVLDSVSRSIDLARGNTRRLAALFLFAIFASYSALMLLVIPLGWVGYVYGINPVALDDIEWPMWYSIGYQVVAQLSTIMITPVWMLGLSLLYVDERVRHEGYDIELQAARVFGDIPEIAQPMPLTPAVARERERREEASAANESFNASVLGLTDRS